MPALDRLLTLLPDPAAPLLTYYDVATGERIELSGTTTANWVAKTANLLVDDLDAEPGTRVRIGLPTHWQELVWLLSAWTVGTIVTDHDADIGVSGPELVADEPVRVAASLRPLGGPFTTPPQGFLDLGVEVPGHGDHFLALDPPDEDTVATDLSGQVLTHAALAADAGTDPRRLLVGPGDVARDARLLVAACAGGGSLVIVVSADDEQIARIAAQEGAEIA
jgi:uncharacterized protein (TIGR03089 family)